MFQALSKVLSIHFYSILTTAQERNNIYCLHFKDKNLRLSMVSSVAQKVNGRIT